MLSCEVLAIIEEFVKQVTANSGKPSFAWGTGGATPANTWLNSHGRPSNKTGIPFGLDNGQLVELWVGNELLADYDISVYYHYGDEVGLTLLKTVNIPNTARTKTFTQTDLGIINVPKDCQVAVRVTAVNGSPAPRNTGAHATIIGTG